LVSARRAMSEVSLLGILGPTGCLDDDLSGIAFQSQAGAQTGFALLWLMPFTYPLMAVTQEIIARLGRTNLVALAMMELALASWETIGRRGAMIARGTCSPSEYCRMGTER
jgi:hypothetical protein